MGHFASGLMKTGEAPRLTATLPFLGLTTTVCPYMSVTASGTSDAKVR